MLIKDPYLESNKKEIDARYPNIVNQVNTTTLSAPNYNDLGRNRTFSGGDPADLAYRMKAYERQLKDINYKYGKQEQAVRKMNEFNAANRQYHEAMRLRNLQLNTKLTGLTTEMQTIHLKSEQLQLKHSHERDLALRKYQQLSQEILRLRNTCSCLTQHKARLQQQVNHLSFLLEKATVQSQNQIRESYYRFQTMERTYKGLVFAKDQQISQLMNRLRGYQQQNRRLNDHNKTLQLTKDRGQKIDNLSRIHHPESNIKVNIKQRQKQNEDYNVPRSNYKDNNELKQQKTINQQLRKQIQALKSSLSNINNKNYRLQQQLSNSRKIDKNKIQNLQGIIQSIITLRNGINKQIFQIFFRSVKDGQKKKSNSLVIFIQNWKAIDSQRFLPYITSYFTARNNLKQIAASKQGRQSLHIKRIQQSIPLKVGARPGRSNINQWILSTIQFTKNQKQSGKKTLNNYLLFLFRLLTIQYRIKYPMQGKSYTIDDDVYYELMHEIVKGIDFVLKYQ